MLFYHLEKGTFPTSNSPSAFSSYFPCFYCTASLAELVSSCFVVWQAGSNKKYGARFLTRATQTASLSFPGGESKLVDSGDCDAHYIFHRGKCSREYTHRADPKEF